ncbi:MAG: fasciclin domain-containing protein [Elainellaceae cyanobacterium]
MPDIVEIAVSTEGFSTLVAAVQAADLVDVLKGEGPFTVFAPTDDAFAKLPPGTVQTLVENPPQLARILKYHVVSGRLTQLDLQGQEQLTSVEGAPISLNLSDGFEVKNATVTLPDVAADNGVIHVIDTVILMG